MKDRMHIILAGEEGKVRSFAFSKKKVKKYLCFSALTFFSLFVACMVGMKGLVENCGLRYNLAHLKNETEQLHTEKKELQLRLAQLEGEMHIKVTQLEAEKKALLDGAVSQLHEKNDLIHQVLSQVGFNLEEKESNEGVGGPYIPVNEDSPEAVLFKTEKLLETLHVIPLGFPADGYITSSFGIRRDPFTGRLAFHEGIDIKNATGAKIYATADGIVSESGYDTGYGRYLVIDHENGFSTRYAHLKEIIAPKGKEIKRGDLVGLLGNTGRSTGPHLHYEVKFDDKPFDPYKFMNIAEKIEKNFFKDKEKNEVF